MKASEFMVGDWFMFDTEHYEPYERVREYAQVGHFNYGVVYGNDGYIAYCEDAQGYNERKYEKVMPIPLTKEMLVNDEFYIAEEASHNAVLTKKTDDALIVVLLIGNSFVLNIERNIEFEGTYAIDSVHKCGYFVHEYQHALRLCGLNDLADNFKVTNS